MTLSGYLLFKTMVGVISLVVVLFLLGFFVAITCKMLKEF